MQAFLIGILGSVLEKLIAAGLVTVEGWLSQWTAGLKQGVVDQANLKALQAAQASGNQAAIDQAGQNLLNGVKS